MDPVLVPYSDETRLGRGINSFTLQPCLDNRVEASSFNQQVKSLTGDQNDVTYASGVVRNLSEVASCLGISCYSSINKGFISHEDSFSIVDETMFNSADTNILMAIRSVSRKRCMHTDELKMNLEGGAQPGTHTFNDIYGDSYYSELVEGGFATVVLSITVLGRSNVKEAVDKIENTLDFSNDYELVIKSIVDAYREGSSNSFALALKGTRTHASLSCTGNGYLETSTESESIETMLGVFLDFPKTVIEGAGWAWATTSTYTSNPSFKESLGSSRYPTLDYTQVKDLAETLLDSFMSFKCLLKDLQAAMNGINSPSLHDDYNVPAGLSLQKLVIARKEIREEMAKIVEATDVISRDPWIVPRQRLKKDYRGTPPSTDLKVSTPLPAVGTNGLGPDGEVNDLLEPIPGIEQLVFDFDRLQSPQVWKHLIPTKKHDGVETKNTVTVTQSLDATCREYRHRLEKQKTEAEEAARVQNGRLDAAIEDKEKIKVECDKLILGNKQTQTQLDTAIEDKEKIMSERDELIKEKKQKEIELDDERRNVSRLTSDRDSWKLQASPKWEPKNNLDIGFHKRTVILANMYTLDRQDPGNPQIPYALDTGRDNGTRVHGWSFNTTYDNQQLTLTRANPESRTSAWLIDCHGRYLHCNNMYHELACSTSADLKSWYSRWFIRKSEDGPGYIIENTIDCMGELSLDYYGKGAPITCKYGAPLDKKLWAIVGI